jgi:hypothetical protein
MKKAAVIIVLILLGAKCGVDYLFSERFQEYGDRTKATWTCEVNMVLGEFLNIFSRYDEAGTFFKKIADRCPDTPVGEEAEFEYARTLENRGLRSDAIAAYQAFAEKYPATRRGRLAAKAAGILST